MADPEHFRDTSGFAATLDAAAERLTLSATAVEKDYWVTQVLRTLCEEFPGGFVFKGGTSLSKGYHLIERFSEDVDILVLRGDRGRAATDTLMKEMGAVVAHRVDGEKSPWGGSETGRHRAYEISYPARRPATDLLRTSVVLEMGVRGGDQPRESVAVGCLLGDVLAHEGTDVTAFADLRAFDIEVLHPGRTLVEKLVLVHGEAQALDADEARKPDRRVGRHFYDIHQLLDDSRVLELLGDRGEFERVVGEIEEVTRQHFRSEDLAGRLVVRPEAGFAASPAFDRASSVSARLQEAYESTMPDLYYGAEPLPTWEAIGERVHAAGKLL